MSNIFTKPRGTQDMLYDKARSYNKIVDILNSVATNYGASPIQIPMYEESRLFKRGVGNSTDIVMKETFDLANKGDHDYSLRPEFTAGIMRAIIENKLYASPDLPLKLYYSGSIFRYERPQQGRYREPHQWGIEFTDVNLDDSTVAEAILVMVDGLKALGIDPIIKLNNLGGDVSRSNYRKALVDYFTPLKDQLCSDCQKRLELNPLRILDCKVPEDHELVQKAPILKDYLIDEDKEKFARLLELLDSCNVKYTLDDKLVRGLDYYTGPVFEAYEANHLELGALGGGGRYDKLMETLGGPAFNGVGFSFGLDRLLLTLGDSYQFEGPNLMVVVSEEDKKELFNLKHELRNLGISVLSPTEGKKLNGALKMADRLKVKNILFKTPEGYQLKNLITREQKAIDINNIQEIADLVK